MNMEGNRVDAMCDAYRLIPEAVPNISVATQQKCTAAMKTAFDLTRLGEGLFGAYVRHQSTRENLFGSPVLDSEERSANRCDFGDVLAVQFRIFPMRLSRA